MTRQISELSWIKKIVQYCEENPQKVFLISIGLIVNSLFLFMIPDKLGTIILTTEFVIFELYVLSRIIPQKHIFIIGSILVVIIHIALSLLVIFKTRAEVENILHPIITIGCAGVLGMSFIRKNLIGISVFSLLFIIVLFT